MLILTNFPKTLPFVLVVCVRAQPIADRICRHRRRGRVAQCEYILLLNADRGVITICQCVTSCAHNRSDGRVQEAEFPCDATDVDVVHSVINSFVRTVTVVVISTRRHAASAECVRKCECVWCCLLAMTLIHT